MIIPSIKPYYDLLARHIRPVRWQFALLAGLLLGGITLQVVNPQILRGFIDTALAGAQPGSTARLAAAAAAFLGIALVQQAVSVGVTYLGESVAWTATNALRAELARHCLGLDMSFHNQHTPGELIERIDGDVTELATFFSQFAITLVGNLLLMAGILIALFLEDWRAGLAFSLFAGLSLFALNRVRGIAVPHQKARRQAEADLFGFVEEQLAGAEDIRSSGAVGFSLRELTRLQRAIYHHDLNAQQKAWVIRIVTGSLLALGNGLAILVGYRLYIMGEITIGAVYLFVHYINLLEQPIIELTRQVANFQTIDACIQRISELREIQTRLPDSDGAGASLPEGALSLAFDGVSFAYQASEPVLDGLSFRLKPGSVLGLLGRTGSGKTTLARLVFRLYDPTAGRIFLEDIDLRDTSLQALHQRVAIVTQDVQLFRASLRENLTFFDRGISDQQIEEAIYALDLGDWYRALPSGLDTRLETGGHSLSAGEAQLLAFTRIFLRQPGLVILDEASSRLDPLTEKRIERAIDRLLRDRTAIVIAHRLHTLHRADEVMILEEGQIGEYGSRALLAADPGSQYYRLLQTGLEELLA